MSPPGNAAEILSTQHEVTQKYLDLGTEFVAVGVDMSVLMTSLRELLAKYKADAEVIKTEGGY